MGSEHDALLLAADVVDANGVVVMSAGELQCVRLKIGAEKLSGTRNLLQQRKRGERTKGSAKSREREREGEREREIEREIEKE